VIADLSGATLIDSTTLAAFIRGFNRLRPRAGTLVLVCTQPDLLRLLEITGLVNAFPVYGSLEDALDALRQLRAQS
jgi:anti-sigma B factor antagonist